MLALQNMVVKCLIANDSNLICTKTKTEKELIHTCIGKFKDIHQARLDLAAQAMSLGLISLSLKLLSSYFYSYSYVGFILSCHRKLLAHHGKMIADRSNCSSLQKEGPFLSSI